MDTEGKEASDSVVVRYGSPLLRMESVVLFFSLGVVVVVPVGFAEALPEAPSRNQPFHLFMFTDSEPAGMWPTRRSRLIKNRNVRGATWSGNGSDIARSPGISRSTLFERAR